MPFTYSENARKQAIQSVLEGLRAGTPLTVICASEGMPSDDTIRDWGEKDEELGRAIARARKTGHDVIATRARETARGSGDSTGDVQRDKLIIETDLKLLAKWDPKGYGDKQLVGSDPDNPLPAGVSVVFRNADRG